MLHLLTFQSRKNLILPGNLLKVDHFEIGIVGGGQIGLRKFLPIFFLAKCLKYQISCLMQKL